MITSAFALVLLKWAEELRDASKYMKYYSLTKDYIKSHKNSLMRYLDYDVISKLSGLKVRHKIYWPTLFPFFELKNRMGRHVVW